MDESSQARNYLKGGKQMRAKLYICDDCGREDEFTSYVKARAACWAVAKDYSKCYCPSCAPEHRKGGANGKAAKPRPRPPRGLQQLKIDNLG